MKMQDPAKLRNKARRIEPLEVLPVFLKLDGKRVVVVGGSTGALWKMELLLQAGAHVTAVCAQPTPELFDLLSTNWPGHLDIALSDWRDVSFKGAALVIGDVGEAEARTFYDKARDAGAIVNVIDKPHYCDIQFGAIVNHSPVVIGISTGGAAPVLAQLVRSMIETALPQGLQALAKKAQSLRHKINARLHTSEARRRYWSAFFERLQGGAAAANAGPYYIRASDVQQLTVCDLAQLRNADHLYVYPGANEKIAQLARREAQRHAVSQILANESVPPGSVIIGANE
jgi:siroheme synthase-like protein